MTFWQWVNKQKRRDDAVGDIARDIIADPTWPRRSWKLTTLMEYLESYAASPNAVRAFAQAWGEWHADYRAHEAACTGTDGLF